VLVYLRHTTRHKDGKTHVYWQLVRSVRRGRKVVQETVAQLGELDAEGRARAEALARSIAGRAYEFSQGQLFDRTESKDSLAVKLDSVRLERSRSFGAVSFAPKAARSGARSPRGRAGLCSWLCVGQGSEALVRCA